MHKEGDPRAPIEGTSDTRRSRRFSMVVPVEVCWKDSRGASFQQVAMAREVNAHGGLLQMTIYPRVGDSLELINHVSGAKASAHAVSFRHASDGEFLGLAIELQNPSHTFWGMTYELKKTSNELVELEERLRAGGVDQRILRDFRDAVDYIRKTAWVVYEWQERQLLHRDTATVMPMLTAERIRRVIQLHHSILSDLEAHHVQSETPGLAELLQSIQLVSARLSGLLASDVKP